MALPISDNFTRADSSTVNLTWTDSADTGDHLTIFNNKMRAYWGSSGTQGARSIYQTVTEQNDVTSTTKFRLMATPTIDGWWGAYLRSGADGGDSTGWGVLIIYGTPGVANLTGLCLDNGSVVGTTQNLLTPGTLLYDTDYNVEIKWLVDNTIEVRCWIASGSRPSVASLSQARATPSANGTNYKMTFAHGTNTPQTMEWLFSSVEVVSSSAVPTSNNALFFGGGL